MEKNARRCLRDFSDRKESCLSFEDLVNVVQEHYPLLADFIGWCQRTYESIDMIPPGILTFIRCLSSVSPVCHFFPASDPFLEIMRELKNGLDIRKNPEKLHALQTLSPIVFRLIVELPSGIIPKELISLFDLLQLKSKVICVESHQLQPVPADDKTEKFSFMPNWPVLTERGRYKQDGVKSGKHEDCNKAYRGHPSLMPGIFILYCEHGIFTF